MTTEQSLSITEMIDKSIDYAEFNSRISYTNLISEIKSLEESSQKKAKEEERNRIVGILEDMIEDEEYHSDRMLLKEAIQNITSNNQ